MTQRQSVLIVFLILIAAFGATIFDASQFFATKFNWQLPGILKLPFLLGLDLQGGTHLIYEADLTRVEQRSHEEVMQGLRDVIERRVNVFGVQEPLVQTQKAGDKWRLAVELPGVKDVSRAIEMIGKTPLLEFREQRSEEETKKIIEKRKELEGKSPEEIFRIPDWQLGVEDPYFKPTGFGGQYLKKAEMQFNNTTYQPYISLEFTDDGAKIFEELTARNVGKPLAIYIDNQLISSPTVQEKISGGKAQITGRFTIQEAKALARNLNAGALPVPITLVSQQTVGPILGAISLQQSLRAGMIGFGLVILFLIVVYRLPGLIASFALGIYVVFLLALLKLIPVTLTLAGIGGVILSIGMEVDANVLIFSRMREEFFAGKSFGQAMAEGFSRAWPSIRDGKLTTLMVAVILFYFGTSFVKGFALTLAIGLLIGLFSAIFVTRNFLRLFEGTRFEKWGWLWR
jgi:preprotein translocase subunit SecD